MRILVIGAGVLGSYMAHALVRGGNEVTVLARAKRAEQLQRNGLVIRHYFQRKNTVDRVRVITELEADDLYDLIFVVMKYNDFPAVLPVLAANRSRHIVLVGNNAEPREMLRFLEENSAEPKEVAFGFQLSGGIREPDGRVICIRTGGQMVLGGLEGDTPFKALLDEAFRSVKYKLTYLGDMDAWLKNHIVPIVGLNIAGYLHDFNLKQVAKDKALLRQAVAVMIEGFGMLEDAGYALIPADQARMIRKYPKLAALVLKMYHRMPFAKLVDGSFSEIAALLEAFGKLKALSRSATPAWDEFERRALAKYGIDSVSGKGTVSIVASRQA